VSHPWFLYHVNDAFPGQTIDLEVPAEFDLEAEDDMEYTVEAILDCRIDRSQIDPGKRGRPKGLLQYLVQWTDYPVSDANPPWELYMYLTESADMVHDYHQ
jgi:hypothetical protein